MLSVCRLPCSHFPNRCQWNDAQQHPATIKHLVTRSCPCHCSHFNDVSVGCHLWLLHSLSKPLRRPFCFAGGRESIRRHEFSQPQALRVTSYRRSGLREPALPDRPKVRQPSKKSKGEVPFPHSLGV